MADLLPDDTPPEGIPIHDLAPDEADEWGEPADAGSIVRPYSWTRGRTRPVQDLAVETLVSTSHLDPSAAGAAAAEHHSIVVLCARPHSVAEVAALLSLPLGVARVLLADMIDTGWVQVHHNPSLNGCRPDLTLLQRVRDGLYRL
jgi:hypothetical protein